MFAAKTKKIIKIDQGDEQGTVTIRKLSAKSLDKSREAKQIAAAEMTMRMGAEVLKALRDAAAEREAKIEKPVVEVPEVIDPNARYATYDRDTTLVQGIESWTFDVPLVKGIDDLDEPTAQLLFEEIIDLSDPPVDKVAETEKNV